MEKVKNQNILSTGLKLAKSYFLNFYRNKINRTTGLKFLLGNGELTPEVVTPFGCWEWEIRFYPTDVLTGDFFVVYLNGVEYNVLWDEVIRKQAYFIWKKPGQPFIEVNDTIQIQNRMGVNVEFYIIFHRVMFDNE